MTSSNGNIFRVTGPLCGEFTGHQWIHPPHTQRPVTRRFDVFFDLRRINRLSKQSRRRRFETTSSSLWRHCNVQSGVMAWKRFPHHWPLGRGMPRGQWFAAFIFSLLLATVCCWTKVAMHWNSTIFAVAVWCCENFNWISSNYLIINFCRINI